MKFSNWIRKLLKHLNLEPPQEDDPLPILVYDKAPSKEPVVVVDGEAVNDPVVLVLSEADICPPDYPTKQQRRRRRHRRRKHHHGPD